VGFELGIFKAKVAFINTIYRRLLFVKIRAVGQTEVFRVLIVLIG